MVDEIIETEMQIEVETQKSIDWLLKTISANLPNATIIVNYDDAIPRKPIIKKITSKQN